MSADPIATWHNAALNATLQMAVPLRIHELAQHAPDERARLLASIDTHELHGDDMMFGGLHAGDGIRSMITGLALLAFAPGGVDFAGLHFCTNHGHCIETGWKAA